MKTGLVEQVRLEHRIAVKGKACLFQVKGAAVAKGWSQKCTCNLSRELQGGRGVGGGPGAQRWLESRDLAGHRQILCLTLNEMGSHRKSCLEDGHGLS